MNGGGLSVGRDASGLEPIWTAMHGFPRCEPLFLFVKISNPIGSSVTHELYPLQRK